MKSNGYACSIDMVQQACKKVTERPAELLLEGVQNVVFICEALQRDISHGLMYLELVLGSL